MKGVEINMYRHGVGYGHPGYWGHGGYYGHGMGYPGYWGHPHLPIVIISPYGWGHHYRW